MDATNLRLSRRHASALIAAAGLGPARADPASGFDDASLYRDVATYDGLGEHRAATAGDHACSLWLRRRLEASGFAVELQSFPAPLYEPRICRLDLDGGAIEAFPAWPVVPTPPGGLRGPLASADSHDLAGRLAVVRLAYGRGGAWSQPHFGEPVMSTARAAAAVVAVTEGPTGGVIALNAAPERFDWPVPVVLVGGADGERLAQAAAGGAPATLISIGETRLAAQATNAIARRRGEGSTLVVSTPKSGWFHCAGERGSGMAVFLALAQWLASSTRRDLVLVATSGHELGETGATHFLRTAAPPPERVAAWLHLGANVAVQELAVQDVPFEAGIRGTGRAEPRRSLFASADLAAAAKAAFTGQPGYETPRIIGADVLPGELQQIHAAGYAAMAGLVGSGPLFHTRLDRADIATKPALLVPVARGVCDLAAAVAGSLP